MSETHCDCGVPYEMIRVETYGRDPEYVAGLLERPCECPKCPFCETKIDKDGRCENYNCIYVGLHVFPEST